MPNQTPTTAPNNTYDIPGGVAAPCGTVLPLITIHLLVVKLLEAACCLCGPVLGGEGMCTVSATAAGLLEGKASAKLLALALALALVAAYDIIRAGICRT